MSRLARNGFHLIHQAFARPDKVGHPDLLEQNQVSHRIRVLRSCNHSTSLLFGDAILSGRSFLEMGGMVRGSCQTLISEWPSAKENVAALL